MAKDNSSSFRSIPRTHHHHHHHSEDHENDPDNVRTHIPHPSSSSSRSPLHSIPDPSKEIDNMYNYHHAMFGKSNVTSSRLSGKVGGGGGKAQSEPNSAQTTPLKVVNRVSNIGTKGGSFSKAFRDISIAGGEQLVQVPYFELVENHSFWKDYNVQVLLRIRPLTNIEKVSQEYWRCLRQESSQSVTWLGQPETRFTFDHVACETISQEELFKAAGLPMVENCMSGYNSCIFAYGQTGSGKTYTMMGEIDQMYGKLHEDCGITPRIFEYLFKRIREEEYNRRDERLKYSCKCSYLEIYNEQITDLLEPSSTNLQLREDLKKGVYVENLSEYSAENVDDILSLLVQGAANRKMAATKMNSESSRSHCVFTCIIESHWEKDTVTHLRFGRLNLVDLAGSERQKSSGAEGDRLKEAANINKSLSTLGLVIMSLVDLAHGKQRHVPYRDSRLTFLLQDSLGGNSKTTIIANVSPSIGSANETLSTLKFAQRAKLIQNNAKVNEDASGDVTALQRQIQHLKGQLSFLLNQHKGDESFPRNPLDLDDATSGRFSETSQSSEARNTVDQSRTSCRCSTMICSKGTLLGAFRREKLADLETKRLKAEIKQMKHIVDHLQEDAQRKETMLRSRDEKIKRLELLADGLTPVDKFLMDENSALREEVQLLKARVEKPPQLSQILLENDRLIEQLRFFEDFYAQEEREILLNEISEIRDQLFKLLEAEEICEHSCSSRSETYQDYNFANELEEQRVKNSELVRELENFQQKLTEHVQPELETEASHTVVHLQEDINLLSELQGRLQSVVEENARLRHTLKDKEDEIKALSADWEKATLELTSFLSEGSKSLRDASSQIESIACLFPHVNVEIGEHVERAAEMCIEKEKAILLLEGNLEDAQKAIIELDGKLSSLRHATVVITGAPRIEDDARNMHRIHLSNTFNGEANTAASLESVTTKVGWKPTTETNLESASFGPKLCDETSDAHLGDTDTDLRLTHFALLEVENAINASFSFVENHFSNLRSDIQETFSLHKECISDLTTGIQDVKRNIDILKRHSGSAEMHTAGKQSIQLDKFLTQTNEKETLHQMRDEHSASESSSYMEESSTDFSSSSSEASDDSIVKQNLNNSVFSDQTLDTEYEGRSKQSGESVRQVEFLNRDEANRLCLQENIRAACDTFVKANILSAADAYSSVSMKESRNDSFKDGYEESNSYRACNGLESDHCIQGELKSLEKFNSVDGFFTKFEEAHATMMEADYMLNALLNANESAKQYNYLWKQAGIELKVENEKLVEEIKQLKSINLSNREIELFQEKLHLSLMQIVNLMLSVKSSLQQNVEDICTRVYSDAMTMVEDTRKGISRLRSLLEDISSMMTENGILSFIIHNCQFGELANELKSLHMKRALSASCTEEASAAIVESKENNLCHESGALGHDEQITENTYLKNELRRKEAVLKGILFDLSLLQESLSSRKDTVDESTSLMLTLNQAQQELDMKADQLDKLSIQHRTIEGRLNETENALYLSNSELEEVRGELEMLSEQNVGLKMALKEIYLDKSALEHELEEQRETIENLENELYRMNPLSEEKLVSLRKGVNEDVQRVIQEKEELLEKIQSLQHKLDIAQALCDEKEAIALEACQNSEASKVYAEQKEEEVKILEISIEELECTINVLEKKVYEMEAEVERHRTTGDLLEVELQALRKRLLMVESITDGSISESNQTSRKLLKGSLEHYEVHDQIKRLEEENEILTKEVKQYRDCISELLLHADAQAVQYQQKYKNLEAMVKEVKTESSNIVSGASTQDRSHRTEQNIPKARGSSSPFRCISNLVQHMNIEKDKELTTANQRIEELENLLACRQKQVCLLNTRLAAVESMTHDVIRDLLGVKLDMTNYADFVSQNQLQKLVKDAQVQSQEFIHMEKEVQDLQRKISELIREREMLISEVKRREADELTAQTTLEQLREREYMLATQNEMLKADRSKLQREVVELDEILSTLVETNQDDIK